MHCESLQIRVKVLGQQHPDTGRAIENVGLSLFSFGNYMEAQNKFEEAWEVGISLFEPWHPRMAQLLVKTLPHSYFSPKVVYFIKISRSKWQGN